MDSSGWSLTGSLCLLASFFLIGPEVIREPMLQSMMQRVSHSLARQIEWMYAGLIVTTVREAYGGYFPVVVGRADLKRILPMVRRWAALYTVPSMGIRFFFGFFLASFGFIALLLLLLFNAWARWESDVRGWGIVTGVIFFVFGSATQVALAIGRL